MKRSSLLSQLFAAPLVAGSLFLLLATIAEAQPASGALNQGSLSRWVQLLIQPSGILAALGLGSPIGISIAWTTREIIKNRDSFNAIKGTLDKQANQITKTHDLLNIIDSKLEQKVHRIIKEIASAKDLIE